MLKQLKKQGNCYLVLLVFIFYKLVVEVSAIELNGDFIQGGIIFGKSSTEDKVFYNNQNIPIDKKGNFLIGLGRNHPKVGDLKIIKPNKQIIKKNIKIEQRKYEIQKINNLEKSKVTPPEKFFKRIKDEGIKIRKAKSSDVNFSYYQVGFQMPAQGIITGVYGSQRILNGIPKRPHYGIDIANKIGTPILAPSDGVVVLVEKNLYFSGGTIIISHGRGLSSSLLHLNDILVEKQAIIKKGEVIGFMGESGRATGPHLDWRMELRGVRIDPYLLIKK